MFLSIVIPAYNEGKVIKKNVELINRYFINKFSFEIIVINDGSKDDTNSILHQLKIKNLSIYNNLRNRGKGASIRKGVKKSKGKIVLVADADLSAPINQFEKLYDELKKGYEIVIGSRSTKDAEVIIAQPLKRVITGKVYNLLVIFFLGLNYKDTQCGFKLFDGEIIRNIIEVCKINNFSIDVEILFLAKNFNLKVFEKGIVWKNNTFSKVSLIKDPLIMFLDLFRIRFSIYNIKK